MPEDVEEIDPALEPSAAESAPLSHTPRPVTKQGRPKGSVKESPQLAAYRRMREGKTESDIFAGPPAGKKYVIFRKQPEYSPVDGSWIGGYQRTHEPPFDLNTLKNTYGGGVYTIQRFQDGDLTNTSEVAIAGAPRENRSPSPSAQAPAVAPSSGAMPPLTIRDVVDLAERLRPPPALPPPAPPTLKDQLESLTMLKDVAEAAFGGREKTRAEGIVGIVQAIPTSAWENFSEGFKNFAQAFGSRFQPVAPAAALPAPSTNGATMNETVNEASPWEPIAKSIKAAVLQGVSTGEPTPETLAANLLDLPQAPMLLPLLKKFQSDEIIVWLGSHVSEKTRALLDRAEIREYLAKTIGELRKQSRTHETDKRQ